MIWITITIGKQLHNAKNTQNFELSKKILRSNQFFFLNKLLFNLSAEDDPTAEILGLVDENSLGT